MVSVKSRLKFYFKLPLV